MFPGSSKSKSLFLTGDLTSAQNDNSKFIKNSIGSKPAFGRSHSSQQVDKLLSTWKAVKQSKEEEYQNTLGKIVRVAGSLFCLI